MYPIPSVSSNSESVTGVVLVNKRWTNGDPDELIDLSTEEWRVLDSQQDDRLPYASDITELAVNRVLRSMTLSKAGGPDGVPLQSFSHLTPTAVTELTRVINLSWKTGLCPKVWKSSQLLLIPKSKPGAYRPITV